jgi:hypothetical protein|tara:strand:+ start:12570 stop:12785 length:216 start_codon:yes stop_codon:yes gene_type:complete
MRSYYGKVRTAPFDMIARNSANFAIIHVDLQLVAQSGRQVHLLQKRIQKQGFDRQTGIGRSALQARPVPWR